MITASIFKNGQNQAIRLPKELEFIGVNKVEIHKQGISIIITPIRKNWKSFADVTQADDDFLLELAVKSNSIIVTLNGKDFKPASEFNLKVMTPKEFLQYIGEI